MNIITLKFYYMSMKHPKLDPNRAQFTPPLTMSFDEDKIDVVRKSTSTLPTFSKSLKLKRKSSCPNLGNWSYITNIKDIVPDLEEANR